MPQLPDSLLISSLLDGYRARRFSPTELLEQVLARIASAPDMRVWITLLARERILEYAAALERLDPGAASLPLYGVPFAIKDNIDLEAVPTTAGCPDYSYTPTKSAFVVERLIQAGAVPIGKTNLDQFATGLVGTRSPYGACRNSFDSSYISGGSSSGSAVAVATGLVSFALGTDTAGSGRVPAAFNNIIGLKPTCGALSTTGVVPACRSLDCVSIFALTADDASRVYAAAVAFDPDDCYSRPMPPAASGALAPAGLAVSHSFASAPAANSALDPRAATLAPSAAFDPRVSAPAAGSALDPCLATPAASSALDPHTATPAASAAFDPRVSAPGRSSALDPRAATPAAGSALKGDSATSSRGAKAENSRSIDRLSFRFGVPRPDQLEFFGDLEYRRLFEHAVERLETLGGRAVQTDFAPFLAAARLLYEGPWVAERYCAVGDFLERSPQSLHPVTRQIISSGRNPTAADAFRSQYRLMELRRAAEHAWRDVDFLLTPTAGTIYRISAVEADPIRLNSNLGYYTNFVNLLDLSAVAVPAGFRSDGIPFGVTLVGRAGADAQLLSLADRLHRSNLGRLGALPTELTRTLPMAEGPGAPGWHDGSPPNSTSVDLSPGVTNINASQQSDAPSGRISVAVCGAHMEGLPLNHQLTSRGAVLLSRTRTAPAYKFYALPGGPPHRPGLVRVASGGASIEVEVWSVPAALFGSFVAAIPAPLGIGKLELQDGTQVAGFLCEPYAIANATDITSLGTWRRYSP